MKQQNKSYTDYRVQTMGSDRVTTGGLLVRAKARAPGTGAFGSSEMTVCPARFDGHSQGTVRFGSSGVAPPQRPHGFLSPPPNQDLNS
ncbi:hypothetical protein ACOSQ4_032928 [Xanthoceras sorbifolium]